MFTARSDRDTGRRDQTRKYTREAGWDTVFRSVAGAAGVAVAATVIWVVVAPFAERIGGLASSMTLGAIAGAAGGTVGLFASDRRCWQGFGAVAIAVVVAAGMAYIWVFVLPGSNTGSANRIAVAVLLFAPMTAVMLVVSSSRDTSLTPMAVPAQSGEVYVSRGRSLVGVGAAVVLTFSVVVVSSQVVGPLGPGGIEGEACNQLDEFERYRASGTDIPAEDAMWLAFWDTMGHVDGQEMRDAAVLVRAALIDTDQMVGQELSVRDRYEQRFRRQLDEFSEAFC